MDIGDVTLRSHLLVSLLLLFSVLGVKPLFAQDGGEALRVGVAHRPPFAIRTADGDWQGVAVDLWRMTAEDLGLSYRFVEGEIGTLAEGVTDGRFDVALPVDATRESETGADLTVPFYTATLGVAGQQSFDIWQVVRNLFSWRLGGIVLALSALLLVVGAIVWAIERRSNKDQFDPGVARGLGDGFWWAGVTLTTIGYGDKAPITFLGRAVAMLWMLIGLAVSSALTAALVTIVGLQSAGSISVPEDLHGIRVGAVPGTTSAAYLDREELPYEPFDTPLAGLRAVSDGDLDGFVHSAPVLRWLVGERGGLSTAVSTTSIDPHYVSIALPAGSEMREALNRSILARIAGEGWWNHVNRYLPEE